MIDFFVTNLLIQEVHDELPAPAKIIGYTPKEVPVFNEARFETFFGRKEKKYKQGKPTKSRQPI